MKRYQLAIVLFLAASVAGGGGYFVYDWMYPYRHLREAAGPRTAYVPPIVAEIQKARQWRKEGRLLEARELLRLQLRLYRNAPQAQTARELLGEIHTQMFFSTELPFGKTEYTVKRGDSLWRIARRLDSTPEAIMRANSLATNRLQPGDRLLVPEGDFTVTLDLPNERAVVHNGDGFFKEYPIVQINLARRVRTTIATKVGASSFWRDGQRLVNPSDAERAQSTPWLHLARGNYILYGVSEEDGVSESSLEVADEEDGFAANSDRPPRGIALLKEDLAELQLLIDRGTPVTIIAQR